MVVGRNTKSNSLSSLRVGLLVRYQVDNQISLLYVGIKGLAITSMVRYELNDPTINTHSENPSS